MPDQNSSQTLSDIPSCHLLLGDYLHLLGDPGPVHPKCRQLKGLCWILSSGCLYEICISGSDK